MATMLAQTATTSTHRQAHENMLELSIPLAPQGTNPPAQSEPELVSGHASRLKKVAVVVQLSGVTFASSLSNGLVIVALPAITRDLELPPSLAFWPVSVSGLATASTLLLAGSIADAVGPRGPDLVGCFANGALMIGCGVVQKGTELVALRALQGVGLAMHLACSVSIMTSVLPQGKGRNLAFSCLGLSQPLGFSFGLVLGGILVDTIGWRAGWFLAGGCTVLFAIIGLWAIPQSTTNRNASIVIQDVKEKVDWVGAGLASTAMTLLCYLLAILSADVSRIKEPGSICFLCLSLVAAFSFVGWMHYRVKNEMVALIPNKLWRNAAFSSVCSTIALSFAVINSMELFCSLFFQEVQFLSAIQASIRIVPGTILGVVVNLVTGFFVHKLPAFWIVTTACILSSIAPLLMAVIQPSWPYWGNAFFAQLLQPISCNALFTIGLIVITDIFPTDTQALAGAVFNTASQFGSAIILAILQVISALVSKEKEGKETGTDAKIGGYRASFWAMLGLMISCTIIGMVGLRKVGKVGLKKD